MISNLRQALDADDNFKKSVIVRKIPSQVTVAGIWFDLNLSPGNPKPFYYASPPLEAAQLKVTDGGFQHGGNVAPKAKHLRKSLMMSASATGLPMPMILCDYLMYYPFIDMGETEEQLLTNNVPLPRYADGKDVHVMAILVAAGAGGQTFRIRYTNQDGVPNRLSPIASMNTSTAIGNIITSQTANALASGAFIPLQSGDSGVRSIEGVQMISGPDVGLFTLVMVKPLAQMQIVEQTAPCEIDYLREFADMPQIFDEAYLNYICLPNGSLSGVALIGEHDFTWG